MIGMGLPLRSSNRYTCAQERKHAARSPPIRGPAREEAPDKKPARPHDGAWQGGRRSKTGCAGQGTAAVEVYRTIQVT